jgi:hypothetical protein
MSHSVSRSVFIPAVLAISILTFTADNSNAQIFTAAAENSAQAEQPQPRIPTESLTIGWGIKSGAQWPDVDDVSNGLDHIGGTIGFFIDFNQRGPVGVTGDVLFANSPQLDEPGVPSGTLHILEVPVLLRLRKGIASNNLYGVYGIVGPAFNLKVSGSDDFANQTVDLMFGGGLEVKDILFEARLKRGSRDRVLAGVTSSFTQQTFAILVGFRMRP